MKKSLIISRDQSGSHINAEDGNDVSMWGGSIAH